MIQRYAIDRVDGVDVFRSPDGEYVKYTDYRDGINKLHLELEKVRNERNAAYTKGYVKGNVEVISHLANTMKNNASPEQLLSFAKEIIKRQSS